MLLVLTTFNDLMVNLSYYLTDLFVPSEYDKIFLISDSTSGNFMVVVKYSILKFIIEWTLLDRRCSMNSIFDQTAVTNWLITYSEVYIGVSS